MDNHKKIAKIIRFYEKILAVTIILLILNLSIFVGFLTREMKI